MWELPFTYHYIGDTSAAAVNDCKLSLTYNTWTIARVNCCKAKKVFLCGRSCSSNNSGTWRRNSFLGALSEWKVFLRTVMSP